MPRGSSRARAQSGFTLIEVLVALVVSGMVIAGAFASLSFTGDSWARMRGDRGATLGGASTRLMLQGWLRGVAPVEEGGPLVGERRTGGQYPADRLAFVVGDAGPLYPGPHRIRLWVDADPATPAAGLSAELTPLRGGSTAPAETLSVAPAALGLSLRYQARVNGKLEWLPEWTEERRLPAGIELTLFAPPVDVGFGGLPPLLRVPLIVPVALGGG